MSLLLGALVVFIVTLIVTASRITEPVRDWVAERSYYAGYLLSCFLCFSTWVGLAVGLLVDGPLHPVLDGLTYQAVAVLLHALYRLVDGATHSH